MVPTREMALIQPGQITQLFFHRPDLSVLPPRVRKAIRRREWSNEILLRSIQLGIILLFCFIYAISPKTSTGDTFVPTPYVLAAYLTLSVIGLVWGILREPPDWSSYISIIFDFALLYGLMIGFHFQYEQPASFILKAPALLYVFIFIAIRALRFHPKFVILAGSVAAIGWAMLIFYVTTIDPGDNMLTRSYVEYLTDNRILIGAEVDKLLSILFVTAILAVAVNGSNNLLVTAISEQSAAQDFSRFFDSSVAEGIRSSQSELQAGQGRKCRATIMNVDIRGFTKMAARMDASQVMQFLSDYQAQILPVVHTHGGLIDKFMGDGIMVTFGTMGETEQNSAAQAIAAAGELMDLNWTDGAPVSDGRSFTIGIGIATGEVAFGAVGSGDRLEMTVIGAAVNLSAKLEKHNKVLGSNCLCDLESWELASSANVTPALHGELLLASVEGVAEETRIVRLSHNPPVAMVQKREPVVSREPE